MRRGGETHEHPLHRRMREACLRARRGLSPELRLRLPDLTLPASRTEKIRPYCLNHPGYGILLWCPALTNAILFKTHFVYLNTLI